MTGRVCIVGAGPGAADLLTLRAVRVLEAADVVFHDALISSEVLALAAKARTVAVGKRCGRHSTAQHFINKRLADAARSHDVVVRLKGGDPMLFGRAHEEISYLRAQGIVVEVVPGVTAALAASAELGVSLTRRGMAREQLGRHGARRRQRGDLHGRRRGGSDLLRSHPGGQARRYAARARRGRLPTQPQGSVRDLARAPLDPKGRRTGAYPAGRGVWGSAEK
jgi:siroheme synthase